MMLRQIHKQMAQALLMSSAGSGDFVSHYLKIWIYLVPKYEPGIGIVGSRSCKHQA
jgi:hypothetical protein